MAAQIPGYVAVNIM